MYKHILIPTDGSQLSNNASLNALQLAKYLNAEVSVITVTRPYQAFTLGGVDVLSSPEGYEEQCAKDAAVILDAVQQEARALGVTCAATHIVDERPWQAIIEAVTRKQCDLIHMGSHGRGGFAALVLGSVTQKVLAHAKIPVLVHR